MHSGVEGRTRITPRTLSYENLSAHFEGSSANAEAVGKKAPPATIMDAPIERPQTSALSQGCAGRVPGGARRAGGRTGPVAHERLRERPNARPAPSTPEPRRRPGHWAERT